MFIKLFSLYFQTHFTLSFCPPSFHLVVLTLLFYFPSFPLSLFSCVLYNSFCPSKRFSLYPVLSYLLSCFIDSRLFEVSFLTSSCMSHLTQACLYCFSPGFLGSVPCLPLSGLNRACNRVLVSFTSLLAPPPFPRPSIYLLRSYSLTLVPSLLAFLHHSDASSLTYVFLLV